MALATSILCGVLTIILVALVQNQARDHVRESIGFGLGELAQQAADKLDRGMYERYREINLLARRIADLGPHSTLESQRRMLDDAHRSYGYYSWLGIATVDGKVRVAARGLLEGANVGARPWFRNALAGTHIGDVHEALLLAKLLPRVDGEPQRFVDVAFPIGAPDGRPRAVLGAHLSWQWAQDVERSVIEPIQEGRRVDALIVDTQGLVLLGPPELQGTTIDTASLRAAHGKRGVGYVLERWADGRDYLVGYSQTRGHADYPGLGWTVLLRQEAGNAYAPVQRLGQYALWTGVGLAVLFSIAGALVANWITHPIKSLQAHADRIRHGAAAPLVPDERSYDEVRSLSSALNTLLADLVRRRRELEELNRTLEQRVADRTQELASALAIVQQNAQHINTIIETAHDAFIGMDLDGMVTDWNTQAERMFGWRRHEAIGRPLADLVLPQRYHDSLRRAVVEFRTTGHTNALNRRVERIVRTRQGEEFAIEMTAGIAGIGERSFFSIFLHDISLRKRVDQMKNELVATVSHELRTPLTSMRASLSLLKSGAAGPIDGEVEELVEIAHRHCERLVRLVSDMLDVEKIESGRLTAHPKPQPLAPIVDDALGAMRVQAHDARVDLCSDCVAGAAAARAEVDRDRITQVLLNLLSNALKFAPPESAIDVTLAQAGRGLRITVADRGPGIPAAFRARIFQRFAQANSGADRKTSSGLGLAISRQILVEHGGELWFEDRAGGGTCFHVDLPLAGSGRVAAA
ncbi:sensor histidine kinase [Telluria beijingensis]|uniref:sensor histidine kinase n=1 Tax=Telluria beijingensis TaxID=3068633 RepID=UPI0027954308|nr:sensor histidine kinase [Massilia sp. REN29]